MSDERWDSEFTFRPFSQDANVLADVLYHNEYQLPESFSADDVVIDVGAHIGCFAVACLRRGAGKLACYEPDRGNFELLHRNVQPYNSPPGRAACYYCAVSATPGTREFVGKGIHTACGYLGDHGAGVDCITLDGVLRPYQRVRLLKLDCEGAEWEALAVSELLPRCSEIVAELHTSGPADGRVMPLLNRLISLGFVASVEVLSRHANALLLRATRSG